MTISDTPVETAPAATPALPDSPPSEPVESPPESGPTTDAPETEDGQSAEAPAGEPEDWESFKARYFDADDSPYRSHFEEERARIGEEQFERARQWLEPQIRQLGDIEKKVSEQTALHRQANDGFQQLMGRIQKASNELGLDEESLSNILRSNAPLWDALNSIGQNAQETARTQGRQEGQREQAFADLAAAIENGSKLAGKPSLVSRFAPDLAAARRGEKDAGQVWNAWLESALSARYEAGVKDGQSGKAEADKVAGRKGQVPPQNVGAGAGSKPYAQMTYEERAALSPEERDRLVAREFGG